MPDRSSIGASVELGLVVLGSYRLPGMVLGMKKTLFFDMAQDGAFFGEVGSALRGFLLRCSPTRG